ncbi:protein vein isoform X2 [Chelonus insularis]|uniref:protein vein isoform X2 n=1 Tax=Chelonus insularis TaxID=460826 RepID=UPI00158DCA37|nr:protein vein isoform X2 [Chelonus insularis]
MGWTFRLVIVFNIRVVNPSVKRNVIVNVSVVVLVSTWWWWRWRGETRTKSWREGVLGVASWIMRASFILLGILSGWWCALALIAAPPANLQLQGPEDLYPRMSKWFPFAATSIRHHHGGWLSSGYDATGQSIAVRSRAGRSSGSGGGGGEGGGRTRSESKREQRKRCRRKKGGVCRGRNWCPDMDVGNRAFLAPTVFEGKVRSMSSSRKPGSNYAVTFEVKQVYKSQAGFQPLRKNDSVRLHFRDKSDKRNGSGGRSSLCRNEDTDGQTTNHRLHTGVNQQYGLHQSDHSKVVRADIKRGKVYLVFVNRVGPRNFTILGEPVIRSKKNEQAVQAVIRPDYVREVTLSELRDSVARTRERVKLVCRTRGSPPPRVHWLKDGLPLYPRRGLRIQHKRRRSKVVIASARPEDSGRYECIAQSTSGYQASLAAQLLVVHDTKATETTTVAWPRQEQPCPIAGDFCMNGGTCLFFETVGEPACRCAEGFTGLRCETKDVISTGKSE